MKNEDYAVSIEQLESDMESTYQAKIELATVHAKVMKAIPKIKIHFNLEKFRVSLVDDTGFGI